MERVGQPAPFFFSIADCRFLGHLVVGAVMPLFVPDEIYLSLYLGNDARESTRRFLNGKHPFLVYDPNFRVAQQAQCKAQGMDHRRARRSNDARGGTSSSRKRYVMFLGDSMINGSTNVSNAETISAYIEDDSTESINFATMLYTFDQIYLDYKERLGGYKVDVVMVGLPGESTAGLLNQYIPFRVRVESKMPFLKPSFELHSGALSIEPVPSLNAYATLLDNPELLMTLARTDAYYSEFSRYKWFGLMPVSNGLYSIYQKIRDFVRLIEGNDEGRPLLKKLIDQMVLEARERNAVIVFMTLRDLKTVAPGPLHDIYLISTKRG